MNLIFRLTLPKKYRHPRFLVGIQDFFLFFGTSIQEFYMEQFSFVIFFSVMCYVVCTQTVWSIIL